MKDSFLRDITYLRLSLTDRCNLGCYYCRNTANEAFFKAEDLLSDGEILRLCDILSSLGIKKIRLTGGEPLVRPGAIELVKTLSKHSQVYMTTNAQMLTAEVASELVQNGLAGVNISINSLDAGRYKKITSGGDLSKALNAIEICEKLPLKVKLNVVVLPDLCKEEILNFCNITMDKNIDVRFIELMPIGLGQDARKTTAIDAEAFVKSQISYDKCDAGENAGPAKYVRLDGAKGRVGFISALSNHFCNSCNRLRLTSDGTLRLCLHNKAGVNLRDMLRSGRSDAEISSAIVLAVSTKPKQHELNMHATEDRTMNQIGG